VWSGQVTTDASRRVRTMAHSAIGDMPRDAPQTSLDERAERERTSNIGPVMPVSMTTHRAHSIYHCGRPSCSLLLCGSARSIRLRRRAIADVERRHNRADECGNQPRHTRRGPDAIRTRRTLQTLKLHRTHPPTVKTKFSPSERKKGRTAA
jgi:hypothetical protein